MNDTLYTIREASRDYFQGKVSRKKLTLLFQAGFLPGFRVGRSRKATILLYKSGLHGYRKENESAGDVSEPKAGVAVFFPGNRNHERGTRP